MINTGDAMKISIKLMAGGLSLAVVAMPAMAGRILDANGKEIGDDSPPAAVVPHDADLYEKQKRNAAVMDNLVNQTPQYQEGNAALTAIRREQRGRRKVLIGPPQVIQMRVPR